MRYSQQPLEIVRDSQEPKETVRVIQQIDWTRETVIDSKQLLEIVRDM